MMKKNKNILIFLVIGIVLIVSIFFSLNKKEYHELPQVKLKDDINKSGLAIMVESDYQTGEYQQSDSTIFPTDGFTLNRIKSGCVDKNGKDVDALIYNENNKTISIKTKQSVYCYLYYDNLFKGSGTEEEPYQINYIEDLVRLSNSVNKESNTYQDKYFILTRDLDFNKNESYMKYNDTGFGDINGNEIEEEIKTELTTGRGWKPIGGTSEIYFSGLLEGKNHRLDNLYIKNDIDGTYLGLFGRIENGEIDNLTISGEITTSVMVDIGTFVTRVSNFQMNNCHNEVNITSEVGRAQVGGLIGVIVADSEITNCTNKGNISNGNSTGGIVANIGNASTETSNHVKVENCQNYGIIANYLGKSSMGGIVGRTDIIPSNLIITNCQNYGLVTTGKSTATEQIIGGIMGIASHGSRVIIENCDNYGEVRSEYNEANTNFVGNGGGILGRVHGNSKGTVGIIINSNNHAEVNGMRRGGGLVGQVNGGGTLYINKSYNEGNVTCGPYVGLDDSCGGIIGYVNNKEAYVLNTYNKGNVTSQSLSASGIVGNFDANVNNVFMAINSYNIGNVTNSRDRASGIIHSFYSNGNGYVALTLNNVYTIGTLNGVAGNYGLGNLGANTEFIGINNVYHLSDYETSNMSVEGVTTKNLEEIKNKTFVDTLNQNVMELNNAGLETIDENLKGYELEKWGLAANNTKIPVLTRKIEDLSGKGNHGLSYAVKYDSEGVTTSTDASHLGYVNAGLSDYDFGNSFSLALKVKMNQIQYTNFLIGSWETGGIGLGFLKDNRFENAVYTDKYYAVNVSYDFNTTDWYTLLVTYDGNLPSDNLKMYVNGELVGSTNVTGNIKKPDGRGPIIIGGNPAYKYDENYVVIDNVYATYKEALIFDRALTEEKDHISINYKDDINVTNQDELLVWYKF